MRKGAKIGKPSWNANPIYKNCLSCNKEFRTIPAKIKEGKGKYCSKECYLKEHTKNIWTTGICKGCGFEFKFVAHRKQTCCSLSCNAKWKRNRHNDNRRELITCRQCGKEYRVFKRRLEEGRGKFCSRKCYSFWMSENLIGKNAFGWKNGLTPLYRRIRTLTKYYKWRNLVIGRDNKCVSCGSTQNLEVDHIKGFKNIIEEFLITNSKEANQCQELWNINNGRTLCKKCHVNTDNYGFKSINKLNK